MSLDPTPSPARLREMQAERLAKQARGVPLTERPATKPQPAQVTVVLPWSALHSSNGMFRLVGKGYRAALGAARDEADKQLADYSRPVFGEAMLAVRLVLYVPDKRRRDAPNYLKLICDSLGGLVYADDSQGIAGSWRVWIDPDRPRAEVTITCDPTLTLEQQAPGAWRDIELKAKHI
jgi:Holliday junction resolvase RusA-like endonuclease